ncbi:HET-s/LopB domain-containing protein [Beauveria bassiana ARSEF 2860]|uniref:HET-s/LopB domain-containing protein n=1 Tax=Beauveria bassiana (strain ARSEF 2860) TaxID=655819 RepID=J4UFG3_BEAB2|nr:HET-s/LopB domain-containing protein [Beauveria bassiana ARSEF 2860]EJP61252.1 HET-s/LopB domain-containing protein [Beauveria bassiana ARSEF 2860]
METLLPAGGFQLPFQRRLSRLYNDTKKSSDFVQALVPREKQQDPDSDPAHQAAKINESLSRAGLSEVVSSIMSTIKDILAEAEQL